MSNTHIFRWIAYGFVAVVALGVIGQMIGTDTSSNNGPSATVLVIRDSHELRFTNDGQTDLYNCTVMIDGGFSAPLRELKASARASVARAQFQQAMPTDEFYTRALRSTTMQCMDRPGRGEPITVTVK